MKMKHATRGFIFISCLTSHPSAFCCAKGSTTKAARSRRCGGGCWALIKGNNKEYTGRLLIDVRYKGIKYKGSIECRPLLNRTSGSLE